MSATLPLAADIPVGKHITATVFGFTVNLDTIYATAFAGLVVIGLGLFVRAKASAENPTKVQLAWEDIVARVTSEVESSLGYVHPLVVPLSIALFTFILVANWFEIIPTGEHPKYLPSPTADVNLTYALAILVVVGVHIYSFRQRGFKGYFKHYVEPYKAMFLLNVIEELVKPVTLALRLFGNIFAGGIMIAIIGLIPFWALWGPNIIWKLFDMAIGAIQALIFALLTVIYFGMAGEGHGEARASDGDATERQPALSEGH